MFIKVVAKYKFVAAFLYYIENMCHDDNGM